MKYNIVDYCEKGEDEAAYKAAFYKALESCLANGGGEIVAPSGTLCQDKVTFQVERDNEGRPAGAAPDEVIFPVGTYCGTPYFKPPVGMDEEACLKRVIAANNQNADDIGKFSRDFLNTKDYISASFIYGHPADYHGIPMLDASVHEWGRVFRRFKEMRIDTVIFQSALWRELGECFYYSGHFKEKLTCYGVLERMFAAAEQENMHVYLGGYGSVAGWKEHFTPEELEAELANHRACFEELYKLGHFEGMYFPSETAFKDSRLPEKEMRMNTLYRHFADMVKGKNSNLKILVSPATLHDPEYNNMFMDFWNNVLADSNVDIVLPQDCIGNTCSRLTYAEEQWKCWKEITEAQKMTLWSHTEIFERRGYKQGSNLFPATPERVAAQLAVTAPYVSRHCCWEALYFTSDEAGMEGKRLRQYMTDGKL